MLNVNRHERMEYEMMTLRHEGRNMERGRPRDIRTCPPRPSSAGHGTLAQCVPHTPNRIGLMCQCGG